MHTSFSDDDTKAHSSRIHDRSLGLISNSHQISKYHFISSGTPIGTMRDRGEVEDMGSTYDGEDDASKPEQEVAERAIA